MERLVTRQDIRTQVGIKKQEREIRKGLKEKRKLEEGTGGGF